MDLKIYDVRALSADAAFLIDDGKTSILYDTGFAFTGDKIAQNIKNILKDRPLDFIFLTHSHYDHALGTPYVLKHYPTSKVVASEYAEKIFKKPSARATMTELDRKFAKTCGVSEYEDLSERLHADVVVRDGDIINAGDMEFLVIELVGHTKCSIGFYLKKEKLFLSSETLGVYLGANLYFPSCLVGYESTLNSFKKVESLDIEHILVPHFGLLSGKEVQRFFKNSKSINSKCNRAY